MATLIDWILPSGDSDDSSSNGGGEDGNTPKSTVTGAPSASDAIDDQDDPGLPTKAVGGIIGGVAGLVLLVVLFGVLWRWSRRKQGSISVLSARDAGKIGTSGIPSSGSAAAASLVKSSAGSAHTNVSQMSQRPFAIPAALARLTGHSTKESLSPGGERGFYKVSGRKLPSVLEAGGDGYTDPREGATSNASVYQAEPSPTVTEPNPGGTGPMRYALGTPMRPVSGLVQMRPGPARTITATENPFTDPEEMTAERAARHSYYAEPVHSRFTETL